MSTKNVLVTGVSHGLGLAITEALLAEDWAVYGISRRPTPELQAVQARYSGRLRFRSVDLEAVESAREAIFSGLLSAEVPLHGLVNNAAMAYDDLVTNLQCEPLTQMFKVNVFAPMVLTKCAIRNMILHRVEGSIVHVSSVSAHTGYKGLAMYGSTKGALESFSKATAREWGRRGIRSNCVVPGFMETAMSASLTNEQRHRIYERTSLNRATDARSVAATVRFLLGDQASSITGQNIFVDAGTL